MLFRTYWLARLSMANCLTSLRRAQPLDDSALLLPLRLEERRLLDSNPVITALDIASAVVVEGETVTLTGQFQDAPPSETDHHILIEWGDGTSTELTGDFRTSPNSAAREFSATHVYDQGFADGSPQNQYRIDVTITDMDGGRDRDQTTITVTNQIPKFTDLTISSPVTENGLATVTGSIFDPGSLDAHTVSINWGDGSAPSLVALAAGQTTFTATHRYLDDNPTGTPQDIYAVTLTVADADGGSSQAQLSVTVQNVAPVITALSTNPPSVAEGSPLTLNGTFSDVGTLDTHSVTINWGDGTSSDVAAAGGLFTGGHTYAASGDYTISVRLTDDDRGLATAQLNVTIANAIPTLADLTITSPVAENGIATVTGRVVDAGSLDAHTVSINWGDGSAPSLVALAAGQTTFTATHRYLDDNPTGTPQDIYAVTLTVADADGGSSQAQLSVTVQNVTPVITALSTNPPSVAEGSPLTLNGTFSDVGTLDTHSVTINWGDGTSSDVAAAGGLFTGGHTYAASGDYTISVRLTDDDRGLATAQLNVTIANAIPTLADLTITSPVAENGIATVTGSIFDPGSLDAHTVSINWGDGSAPSLVALAAGQTTFTATHRYLDDNPTGTPQDIYAVTLTVADDDGGSSQAQLSVTVQNVAPVITALSTNPPSVAEGSPLTLNGTFNDVGTLDTHSVTINWGDGTSSDVAAAGGLFTGGHTYAASGDYTISVRLTDDDRGLATAQLNVTIANAIPTLADLTITSPVAENGIATVTGRVVDAGSLDAHTVTINWGDGSAPSLVALAAGQTTFTATHRYLDDNPTGTPQDIYTVTLTVADDDGGSSQAQLSVTVQNVAPVITALSTNPPSVAEGSPLTLNGTFSDVGTLDTHSVTINWGDGTSSDVAAAGGLFTGGHTYAASGDYTISVRLTDDDRGLATAQLNVTIANAIPTLADLTITSPVAENGIATVTGRVVDAGSLDAHTVTINWGDGSAPSLVALAAGQTTFTATHRYLDDNPTGTPQDIYAVTLTVADDDGGSSQAQLSVTVQNVAPVITALSTNPPSVAEGSPLTLNGTFSDVGTLDTHSVTINWGDGTSSDVAAAGGLFTGGHTYAASGDYTISVRLTDDDRGLATAQLNVTIANAIPTLADLTITSPVTENGIATVTGRVVDAGSLDAHTVTINWGDGSAPSLVALAAGQTTFTATHRYLDDNPTGTPQDIYAVTLTVADDDGGSSQAQLSVTVQNVAPVITALSTNPPSVAEGSPLTLNGTFSDVGTLDTHSVTINWGDGTSSDVAAAGGLFTGGHTYAASGDYTISVRLTDDDRGLATAQLNVTIANAIPTLADLTITSPVAENGIATVTGRVVDAGSLDAHTVTINWGDGSAPSLVALAAGQTTFTATHRYLDDNPTGTPQDIYAVTLTVADDDGGSSQAQLSVTVQNVAPVITALSTNPPSVAEGSPLTLNGTFSDVGTLDTHSVTINWGDGTSSDVAAAGGLFTGGHTYAASGDYTISVRLTDDDRGLATAQLNVTIANAIPTLADLTITSPVAENGIATVTGRVVDAGSLDAHTVTINWGDGSAPSLVALAAGQTTFTATHRYLDDNPTGTPQDIYAVTLTVADDDGGSSQAQLSVTVQNVAPVITALSTNPPSVAEGSPLTLNGTFSDVGTLDTHSVTINWGDGTSSDVAAAGGLFTGGHTYAASGDYTISVRLTDDDRGLATAQLNVTIANAIPTLADLTITSPVTENGIATVTGRVVDAGSLDAHTVTINWGDGSAPSLVALAAGQTTFTATHRYLDDNPTGTPQDIYAVTLTVADDDGGSSQGRVGVTVTNVSPVLEGAQLQPMPDVDAEFILSGAFSDPGSQDSHTLTINWGDGSSPTVLVYSGGPHAFTVAHVYESEGAFAITATLRDDDGAVAISSFAADVSLETQLIVTEFPEATVSNAPTSGYVAGVVIKSSREDNSTAIDPNPTTSIPFDSNTSDRPVKPTESRGAVEEVVVIEVVSPAGKTIRHQDLPTTILADLPGYIRQLPDGHYRFYFKTPEAQRLIMDVHVRGGQIIDPGDLLKIQQQSVSQTPAKHDTDITAEFIAAPEISVSAGRGELRIDAAPHGDAISPRVDHSNWETSVDSAMSQFPDNSSQVAVSARRSIANN